MTRRDALRYVGAGAVGIGASIGIRFAVRAMRVDSCLACGPGRHVKRVTYTILCGDAHQEVTYTEGVDESGHAFAQVCTYIVPTRVYRSGPGSPHFLGEPEWVCLACGRAWRHKYPSPGFLARMRSWIRA